MVAQVAAEEPEIAAKMVQPTTLVCSRRPGRRSSQGARPLNMLSERWLRNRISPIHKKSGSAVSVQVEVEPQIVSIMLSPTGRLVKNSMPISPTPSSERPIHKPEPSTANSSTMSPTAMMKSMMLFPGGLFGTGGFAGFCNQRDAAHAQYQRMHERKRQADCADGHAELRNP